MKNDRLSNKEVTAIINKIELEFDVNSLTIRGVNFWPFIRMQIVHSLWSSAPKVAVSISYIPQPPKANFLKKGYWILLDIKGYLEQKRNLKKQRLLPNDKTDYIFIAEHSERKEEINNKKIHPCANSLNMYVDEDRMTICEYNYNPLFPYYGNYKVIDTLLKNAQIKNKLVQLFSLRKLLKIQNYHDFESFLLTKNITLNFSEKDFIAQFESIYRLSKEFENLFSKLKTKSVFFTVYFKKTNYAISLACHRLGIKAIEIQHGQQGIYNPQNNGFARIPKNGYKLLPTHFWVWGSDAASYKKDLCASNVHTAVIGGNPWLNAWLNSSQFDSLINIDLKSDKPQIMLALQPLENPFPDFLLEVMARTKNDFLWRVRLHPVMRSRQEELSTVLKAINANFEIEKATSLPLYMILKNCKFIITMWSTVAYEGLYFNSKPIIIHENGKEIMRDYVEKKIFDYAINTNDLMACLSKDTEANKVILPNFIETNLDIIKHNLKPIL